MDNSMFVRTYVTRNGKKLWQVGQSNYHKTLLIDDKGLDELIESAMEAKNNGYSKQ